MFDFLDRRCLSMIDFVVGNVEFDETGFAEGWVRGWGVVLFWGCGS